MKHIPDEEIVGLNLPTAVPYVFEFDNDLNLKKDYFLGDPEKIKKLMEAVADQGKTNPVAGNNFPALSETSITEWRIHQNSVFNSAFKRNHTLLY